MKKLMKDIYSRLMFNILHELHNDLPFLPESVKIEKVEKLVTNLHDIPEYVIHMRNSKQALNHELIFIKLL